jgi:hypothetical protein
MMRHPVTFSPHHLVNGPELEKEKKKRTNEKQNKQMREQSLS